MDDQNEVFAEEGELREQDIYTILRTNILELCFRPGMMISIKDICDKYGIGRSPARDALIRLSREGLVTFLPQRGTMISKIKMERVENQRFMRRCIEEQVMMEFMANCDLKWLTAFECSNNELNEAYNQEDYRKFLNIDDNFHSIFYRATGRAYINEVLQLNSGDYRRLRLLVLTEGFSSKDIISQHNQIISAIVERDMEELHRVFVHHIDKLLIQERTMRKKYPDLFNLDLDEVRREPNELQVDFLIDTKLKQ